MGSVKASDIEDLNCTYEFFCTSSIPQTETTVCSKPITNQEVLTHSQALNSLKSAGPDDIPLKFSAISGQILPVAPVLVELCNICIIKGIYPNTLKIG